MGHTDKLTNKFGNFGIKVGRPDGFRLEVEAEGLAIVILAGLTLIETCLLKMVV